MIEVSLVFVGAAFLAGVLMFLAPCTLPLLPAFLAFISGTQTHAKTKRTAADRRKILQAAGAFVIGFTVVFVAFGLAAGVAGFWLGSWRALLSQIGGVFIIVLALVMLGALNVPVLSRSRTFTLPAVFTPGSVPAAAAAGSAFALGWTPCVGPVLATILLMASSEGSALVGGMLLLVFSLGLAIPFIITAWLFSQSQFLTTGTGVWAARINLVGAVVLLLVGIVLLTNSFGLLVSYGYALFHLFGFSGLFEYL